MDQSLFDKYRTTKPTSARTPTEALIEQIVDATTEQDKKKLARALAITAKTLKWSDQQLHMLYQKRLDPKVRNFTALVWWHCKVSNASAS